MVEMKNLEWHSMDADKTASELGSSITEGIMEKEAVERFSKFGPNLIEQKAGRTKFRMFFDQFKDFMVIVLLAAAAISGLLGEWADTVIILVIVLLNALLGMIQENKSEQALKALKMMAAPNAKVIRGGMVTIVPAQNLVQGDLVIIEAGDYIPADLRLIESANLKIDESALTGESLPSEKDISGEIDAKAGVGDRLNMAFSSTIATYGRGRGIVVGTGMNTEIGNIAGMIMETKEEKTPLQVKLNQLGKLLGIAAIVICSLIFVVGLLYGRDVFEMFLTAVSLAVAAIPEGLTAVVTIVLAIGVQRMAKRNAIIRNLPSVETLGSATVICSDKTGTLTQNKMTVVSAWIDNKRYDIKDINVDNADFKLITKISILCNDAQIVREDGVVSFMGDPTETAFVAMALDKGMDKHVIEVHNQRMNEIPFDSVRKRMTTINKTTDGYRVYVKGAVDEMLPFCTRIKLNGDAVAINEYVLDDIKSENESMAKDALRVLAMAYKDLDVLPNKDEMNDLESDLIFAGMLGMIDPPREEVKRAVAICKKAGIKTVMITGDHLVTAMAIADALGIFNEGDGAVTGAELQEMTDEELKSRVANISVYARVSPEHKVRIVEAWKAWGHVVAMTGDGVNDAPALKRADIGASMGKVGTDVAKEASDMVLTDDNFSTIVAAVEEGRIIYANILKAIQFLLSCNVGEIVTLFVGTMLNWHELLLPIHILWINLVTDGLPALTLGMEPGETDIMDKKPRDPNKGIFTKGMITRISWQGVMIGALTLTAFIIGRKSYDIVVARTMAFAVLALSQMAHVLNLRSNKFSIFKMKFFSNPKLIGAVALSVILEIMVISIPGLNRIFHVVSLNSIQWAYVAFLSISPIIFVELAKLFKINMLKDEEK